MSIRERLLELAREDRDTFYALADELREAEHRTNLAFYAANKEALAASYPDQCMVIMGERVVATGYDYESLNDEWRKPRPHKPIMIECPSEWEITESWPGYFSQFGRINNTNPADEEEPLWKAERAANRIFFKTHRKRLSEEYPGKFIAIAKGAVVASGSSRREVYMETHTKYPGQAAYIDDPSEKPVVFNA